LLVASAFGASIWGPGKKSEIPRTGISSGKVESAIDHIKSGMPDRPERPGRPESPQSGHKSGSPKSGNKSGSGRKSGPGHRSPNHSPHRGPGHPMSGKKDEKHHQNGCGGNCGEADNTNVNFAPVNTNVQNFVNIETDINTNINVGAGGGSSNGGHHFKPIGIHHPHGEADEVEDEVATDQWGWPIWDGGEEQTDDSVEVPKFGFPVWDGSNDWEDHDWESDPDVDIQDILAIVTGKLGINNPSDMMARLDKDEVRTLIGNFLSSVQQDKMRPGHGQGGFGQGGRPQDMMARLDKEEMKTLLVNFLHTLEKEFDHQHDEHHQDHESDDNESDDTTNQPGTDNPVTSKPQSPVDNESGKKPKSPVDNES